LAVVPSICSRSKRPGYLKAKYIAYTGTSFVVFAEKAGIPFKLARQAIDSVLRDTPKAIELLRRSFLSEEGKNKYIEIIGQRHRMLGK
jgi:serine/threonine-protein kinase HipA